MDKIGNTRYQANEEESENTYVENQAAPHC